MKTIILISLLQLLLINSFVAAQSDYLTVQNFKKESHEIELSIKNVSSINEFDLIEEKIQSLKNNYAASKPLLDKALYPENFQVTFDKIESEFESKKKDFSRITTLTSQVESLQTEVAKLNQKNEELIKQINEFRARSLKDQSTINELKNLISQLRGNINQRDQLVRDLVDSLLAEFIKMPEKLSQKDAQSIISKVNKGNLFYNVERAIDDNIQFLKVTRMNVDDYGKVIKQYHDFHKVWEQIGPRLSNVYLTKKQKKSEIPQIDSLFESWNSQIQVSIWTEIQNIFHEKNINLAAFNDANSFIKSAVNYINDEITNVGVKNKNESEQIFHTFVDSVYFKTVQNKWIPLLIENHMMAQNEREILDAKIGLWQKEFVSPIPYWVYIVGGIMILFIAVYFYQKRQGTFRNSK